MTEIFINTRNRPYNLPIEVGLRSLFILAEVFPVFCDLQRLVYYDYLLVYSGDVKNGPPSLHPQIPHRGGGWLVRRQLVESGLNLMLSKELIQKRFDRNGVTYGATDLTKPFLNYLTSEYAQAMKNSAKWVAQEFRSYKDQELSIFMRQNLGRWGAEFDRESIIRGQIT